MTNSQKVLISFVILFSIGVLYHIARYWYSDYLYAKGNPQSVVKAVLFTPNEPLYRLKLANYLADAKDPTNTIKEAQKTIELSPANVNIKRQVFSIYLKLAIEDPVYLPIAMQVLLDAAKQAPTDAKLMYNIALTYERMGQRDLATQTMIKTIELKPNYKEARLAYAIFLIEEGEFQKARNELNYILEKIDSRDELVKQTLESIN